MDDNFSQKELKEKRIKKEMSKIKKVFKNLSKEKLQRINDLIYRASFLLVMAQDMEEELLNCDTYTTRTVNASQTFLKTHPLCKDYRDTIKSYQAVIKQLDDLTKDDMAQEPPKDALDEFLES